MLRRLRRIRVGIDPVLVLALLLCVGLFAFIRRDISPMNHYLGDDGRDYVEFLQHFDQSMEKHDVSRYAITRVGALWFVRKTLLTFDIPLEAPEIVHAWQILNAIALAISLTAYLATLRRMHVSTPGRALGVAVAFGAYAIAKWPYFYPNMIDTLAVMLGALFAYFWVRRSPIGIAFTLCLGLFTWPYLLGIVGVVMLAFGPKRPLLFVPGEVRREPEDRAPGDTGITWLCAGGVGVVLGALVVAAIKLHEKPGPIDLSSPERGDPFERYRHYDPLFAWDLLPITVPVLLLTGIVPIIELLRGMRFRDVLGSVRVVWALFALGIVAIALHYQAEWADVRSWTEPPLQKLVIQFALTINRPAQALVGHLAFFGIATVLVLVFFRDFTDVARRMGVGYVAVLCLCFLLLLTSEARQEAPVLFLILPVLVKAIDQRGVRWPLIAFVGVGGAITSEVWLDTRHIDIAKFDTYGYSFLELPQQWYFLHHALSMNHLAFAAHAIVFAMLLAIGLVVARRWTPA